MLRISQNLLTLLETCPRQFQYSALEQLAPPLAENQQNSIDWGNRFHLLMQQAQLKLPLEAWLEGQEDALVEAFKAMNQANPQLLSPQPDVQYDSEHLRSFNSGGHSFTVVYDLLIREANQAQILDWKTYPKPVNARLLANHWQTKLYCFGLAETSHYLPDQISMTYWFVQNPSKQRSDSNSQPESLRISYDQQQHQAIRQQLRTQANQLSQWVEQYQKGQALPQIPLGKICERCGFFNRCRGQGELKQAQFKTDLGAIAEISP